MEWNINDIVILEIDFFIYVLNNIFKLVKVREFILLIFLFFKMIIYGCSEKGIVIMLRIKRK